VEAVTWAGEGDNFRAVEESVKDGAGGGDVACDVKDGVVEHMEPAADGFGSDGLGEVGFADFGRSDEEGVAFLADEVAGGEFVDAGVGDSGELTKSWTSKSFFGQVAWCRANV